MLAGARVKAAFHNGPALLGVGAVSDKGLAPTDFHVVATESGTLTATRLSHKNDKGIYSFALAKGGLDVPMQNVAVHVGTNIMILDIEKRANALGVTDGDFITSVRNEIKLILALNYVCGMYEASFEVTPRKLDAVDLKEDHEWTDASFTAEAVSRGMTYYAAKGQVKWQTNHCMGGRIPVGGMASVIKANFGRDVNMSDPKDKKAALLYEALYWVLHPVNERLCVLIGTGNAYPMNGVEELPTPPDVSLGLHVAVRHNLFPASTHHVVLAYEGLKTLRSFGLAQFIPNKGLVTQMLTMKWQIERNGGLYHPAASFWEAEKKSINQKVIDLLLADVGYALRKIVPYDTLSQSPVFDALPTSSGDWQKFINAVAAAMKSVSDKFTGSEVIQEIVGRTSVTANDEMLALLEIPTAEMTSDEFLGHLGKVADAIDKGGHALKIEAPKKDEAKID